MPQSVRAFSLTELLVVVTIIVVMASLVGPTLTTALRGTSLSQGFDKVIETVSLARYTAITKGQTVEVRFYCYKDPENPGDNGQCHAFQAFTISDSGFAAPLTKVQQLPPTVVISTNPAWSTLFSLTANATAATNAVVSIPRAGINYTFYAFQCMRGGLTSLAGNVTQSNWCLSMVNLNDILGNPIAFPKNYSILVLDPYNASLKLYRPTL